jgi:TRAP transporter TAXI family solute receptor
MTRQWGKLLVAILLLMVLTDTGFCAERKALNLGACNSTSSWYGYLASVAKTINELVPAVSVNVVETGATFDNIARLSKNQVDMGWASYSDTWTAISGKGKFEGKAIPELRGLFISTLMPVYYVVREDSGVKQFTDLNGKKFNAGMRGSSTEKLCMDFLEAMGVKADYFKGSTEDAVSAIKDGHIVGYAKTGAGLALDATTKDIQTFYKIRILSFTPDQVRELTEKFPSESFATIPAGTNPGFPEITTNALFMGLIVTKSLNDELAYQIVKAVSEKTAYQVAAIPSLKGLNIPEQTVKYSKIPLHPGAIRYYQEKGWKIPDGLIPKP